MGPNLVWMSGHFAAIRPVQTELFPDIGRRGLYSLSVDLSGLCAIDCQSRSRSSVSTNTIRAPTHLLFHHMGLSKEKAQPINYSLGSLSPSLFSSSPARRVVRDIPSLPQPFLTFNPMWVITDAGGVVFRAAVV